MLIVAPDEGFDALVSVAEADEYMDKFGYDAWGNDTSKKEVAIRRASQYILNRYRVKGIYLHPVHDQIKHATCEAAIRAMSGTLFEDVGAQHVKSVKVGPIEREMSEPVGDAQKRFAVIDALMYGMTEGGRNQIRLVRG